MSPYKLHLQTAGNGIRPRTNRTFKKRHRNIFKKFDAVDFVLLGCIVSLLAALGYSALQTNKSLKNMQGQAENPSSLLQKQEPQKNKSMRSRANNISPQSVPQTAPQNSPQNFNGTSQSALPWYKKPPYVNEWDIHKNNDVYNAQSKKENGAKNTPLGIVR